jgi:hypothetical protein
MAREKRGSVGRFFSEGLLATTREQFGTALAALARLYAAAEGRGDMEHAERYSAAVQLLLGAWPSDCEPEIDRRPPLESGVVTVRAVRENTLVGLGTVPPYVE